MHLFWLILSSINVAQVRIILHSQFISFFLKRPSYERLLILELFELKLIRVRNYEIFSDGFFPF